MALTRSEAHAASILSASEACCTLYIDRGTTSLPVGEIAQAIGIPARTFHRYFPSKADTIAPVFAWTTATFNDAVKNAPADLALLTVLSDGFERMLGGDVADRTRNLFPLVFADAAMWAVFLRGVHFGEISLAPILARRMGLPDDALQARAAAAVVASSTRIALEAMVTTGGDPHPLFVSLLETLHSPLFESRT